MKLKIAILLGTMLLFVFGSVGVVNACSQPGCLETPDSPTDLFIVAGYSLYTQLYQDPILYDLKDKVGFGCGIVLDFNKYLGIVGFYDYIPTSVDQPDGKKAYKNDVGVYGSATLFRWDVFSLKGIAGAEWTDTNLREFDEKPGFAFGLLGKINLCKRLGFLGGVTTTMADDFAAAKGKAMLSFKLF